MLILSAVASLLAGAAWLTVIWLLCRPHRARPSLAAAAFIAGAALAPLLLKGMHAVIMRVSIPWIATLSHDGPMAVSLPYYIVIIGLCEETAKFLAVRTTVYYSDSFAHPMSAIVYASAAALGFATTENAFYGLSDTRIIALRVVLGGLAHVMFAMVWGYPLYVQRCGQSRHGSVWVVLGLCTAAVLHGVYDYFLYRDQLWVGLSLLGVLWVVLISQARFERRDRTV